MSLKAVYGDVDGTMAGPDGCLLRSQDGDFSEATTGALGVCFYEDVEVVLMSGQQEDRAAALARALGLSSCICEAGAVLMVDGERFVLAGDWGSKGEPAAAMRAAGIHEELFDAFPGLLEWHSPWHEGRRFTLNLRGDVPVAEANVLLARRGLRIVDNGAVEVTMTGLDIVHSYHVLPARTSKANAVAKHMRRRGYQADETVAVGDSLVDLDVARVVGHCYIVANGVASDPALARAVFETENASPTTEAMGHGFAEAITLAIARG